MAYVFMGTAGPEWRIMSGVGKPQNAAALLLGKQLQAELVRLAGVYKTIKAPSLDGDLGPSTLAAYQAIRNQPMSVALPLALTVNALTTSTQSIIEALRKVKGGVLPSLTTPSKATPAPVYDGAAVVRTSFDAGLTVNPVLIAGALGVIGYVLFKGKR